MPEIEQQLRSWSAAVADTVAPVELATITSGVADEPPPRRTRVLAAAAAAVVLVAGVAALAAVAGRGDDTPAPATEPSEPPASTPVTEPGEPLPTVVESVPDTEPRSPDELAATLDVLGVDRDSAPQSVQALDGAKLCGVEQLGNSIETEYDEVARRCFLDGHVSAQPAVFVEMNPTVEGDPIVTVWRTLADGSITVHVDSTRDAFGSGDWDSWTCSRLTTDRSSGGGDVPPVLFECATPSNEGGRLDTPSAEPPSWFDERTGLPACGYEIRVSEAPTPARQCFADAMTAGQPAELVIVSTGDEGGRHARWFRSLGDGTAEVLEWQSGGDVGAPQTAVPSQWLRYDCPTGLIVAEHTELIPAVDEAGCVVVDMATSATGGVDGPVIYIAPQNAAEQALGSGTLELVDSCLVLTSESDPDARSLVVWKFGTTWDPTGSTVILPGGERVAVGDDLRAGGGFHPIGGVARFLESTAAQSALTACAEATATTDVFVIQ